MTHTLANFLFDVRNVPGNAGFFGGGAAMALGDQGETLRYVWTNTGSFSNPSYTLGEWNSTLLFNGSRILKWHRSITSS